MNAALMNQIQAGKGLKKVADHEKNDRSSALTAIKKPTPSKPSLTKQSQSHGVLPSTGRPKPKFSTNTSGMSMQDELAAKLGKRAIKSQQNSSPNLLSNGHMQNGHQTNGYHQPETQTQQDNYSYSSVRKRTTVWTPKSTPNASPNVTNKFTAPNIPQPNKQNKGIPGPPPPPPAPGGPPGPPPPPMKANHMTNGQSNLSNGHQQQIKKAPPPPPKKQQVNQLPSLPTKPPAVKPKPKISPNNSNSTLPKISPPRPTAKPKLPEKDRSQSLIDPETSKIFNNSQQVPQRKSSLINRSDNDLSNLHKVQYQTNTLNKPFNNHHNNFSRTTSTDTTTSSTSQFSTGTVTRRKAPPPPMNKPNTNKLRQNISYTGSNGQIKPVPPVPPPNKRALPVPPNNRTQQQHATQQQHQHKQIREDSRNQNLQNGYTNRQNQHTYQKSNPNLYDTNNNHIQNNYYEEKPSIPMITRFNFDRIEYLPGPENFDRANLEKTLISQISAVRQQQSRR